jgi:hypothetical protein
MHRFPSQSVIVRFKFVAVLFCLGWTLIPVVACALCYSVVVNNPGLAKIGIALLALAILILILQFSLASRTRCPLCMTPVLASKRCSRLRVAVAILFRNGFKCPYCHESAVLEVRSHRNENELRRY